MALNSNQGLHDLGSLGFNSIFYKLLHQQGGKVLSRTCKKHPSQHLIQFGNQKPFCPIDHQDALNQRDDNNATKYYYQHKKNQKFEQYQYNKNFLYTHSILSDPTIKKANFGNFSTFIRNPRTKEGQKESAKLRKIKQRCQNISYQLSMPQISYSAILCGPVGRGKSHLAMSMAKFINNHIGGYNVKNRPRAVKPEMMSKIPFDKGTKEYNNLKSGNVRCMFLDISQMFQDIKTSWSTDKSFAGRLEKDIRDSYLVVFDDIGSEIIKATNNSWKGAYLKDIFSSRQNKANIVTTNDKSGQITKDYSSRVYSRLFRNTKKHIVSFPQYLPDMRLVAN